MGRKKLPFQPEKMIDHLMQAQDNSITSVAARVLGSGGAKMRKTGAHTAPEPAQKGARATTTSLVSPAPEVLLRARALVEHDPLLAVIEKYQEEFDHLRE